MYKRIILHLRDLTGKATMLVARAVTKALIGGGGYSCIRVLPDEFLLK